MKKVYLLTFALITGMLVNAQSLRQVTPAGKQKPHLSKNVAARHAAPASANIPSSVIWSSDFGNPLDWTITHAPGTTGDWTIGSVGPSGQYAILPINTNGDFALFDSDLICSGDQIGQLTNSNPIDMTAHTNVRLEFSQYYCRFADSTYVYVSNNGSTWTRFEVNAGLQNNQYSANNGYLNPNKVYLDISSVAGSQDSVYVRFEFYSPDTNAAGPNPLGGCGYAWMIDDVILSDILPEDAYIMQANAGEYSWIPAAQFEAFQFRGRFHNWGLQPITGAKIAFAIADGLGNILMYDTSAASGTVNPGDTSAYLLGSATFTPTDTVFHTLTQQIIYATDGDYANDTSSVPVAYNDSIYARDLASLLPLYDGTYGLPGTTVSFGQFYHIYKASDLTSATFYLERPTIGANISVSVYSVSGGAPGTSMGSSANYTITFDDSLAQFITLPFSNPISATPGDYCLVISQLDTNFLSLGHSSEIYTAQKVFYKIGPGAWTPAENSDIFGSFLLWLNNPSGTILSTNSAPDKLQFNVYPNPSQGYVFVAGNDAKDVTVEVTNSLGQVVKFVKFDNLTNSRIDLNGNPSGVYNVRVSSAKGEITKTIVLQ